MLEGIREGKDAQARLLLEGLREPSCARAAVGKGMFGMLYLTEQTSGQRSAPGAVEQDHPGKRFGISPGAAVPGLSRTA